jgi:hypothetical protein
MSIPQPVRSTRAALTAVAAVAVAAVVPMAAAAASPNAVTAKDVHDIRLVALAGHHDGNTPRAPFYAVFSTDKPMSEQRDDEGVVKYPGGVGIDGPAGMRIYRVAHTGGAAKHRWCYSAEAASNVWRTLRVGRRYPVQVAVSNDDAQPRAKARVTARRTTIVAAAHAIGC